ncbi:MAG: hypothetical protein HC942_17885 [Microcoleus sp. SU_5_6]|nr:hypothetical protein [Microcoleus sp. SU_5_6]
MVSLKNGGRSHSLVGGAGFEIVNYCQVWLVNPPLQDTAIVFLWWGGGGFFEIVGRNSRWLVNPPLQILVLCFF